MCLYQGQELRHHLLLANNKTAAGPITLAVA
jgi:hypothetical protein